MLPPRRRSARLASAAKPRAAPELSSVAEREDTPPRGAPQSLNNALSPPRPVPATPMSSALKPPHDEMHPSKVHQTTEEPSSALRLGFSDIPSRKDRRQGAGLTATPSRVGGLPSSPFTFHFARDTTLSGEAQRMMGEIRQQAAKIKADLVAQREAQGPPATADVSRDVSRRVIAKPKGKFGRFSAAHVAEFKKMDSIEGHASAWRAQNGRFTPVQSSLKRSPSKSNLEATPTSHASAKPLPSKTRLFATPDARPKPSLKRTSSVANLDYDPREANSYGAGATASLGKALPLARAGQLSAVKRLKQHREDDSSSARPVSRDGSCLPRPVSCDGPGSLSKSQSSLARLMSPTKSSTAHAAAFGKPATSLDTSPSKTALPRLAKTTSATNLGSASAGLKRRIVSPGRFQKVKSILRGQRIYADSAKSAIPQPAAAQASQTPAPLRTDKALPPLPMTTPRRKLSKRVAFTPDAAKAAMSQGSPSPEKPSNPNPGSRAPLQAIDAPYPGLDHALAEHESNDGLYPDLSPLKHLVESQSPDGQARTPSLAGTFSFRSDHTIMFGDVSEKGFGASPGQSSVRHVRGSVLSQVRIPGGFPAPPSPSTHSNKENAEPSPARMLPGRAHGMLSKKRHRASSDKEDAEMEAAERALKKRKNEHVPEGQALLAPRLVGAAPASGIKDRLAQTPGKTPGRTPGRAPGSAGPSKKGPVLSMSRLNMLARPKNRG